MEAKKIMVKPLFDRGFSAGEIFKQLKCLGMNKLFIYWTINWLLETNSCKNRARPGHHRSARTKERIKKFANRYEEIFNFLQIKLLLK